MGKNHITEIEIRFADMDAMGHVNNAKYFSYFEQARIKYLDDILGTDIKFAERGVIVGNAHADFKIPVKFRDKVRVYTNCPRIGTKSFEISYSLVVEKNGNALVAATGSTVMVCFDYGLNHSIEIPDEWKKKIIEFENV